MEVDSLNQYPKNQQSDEFLSVNIIGTYANYKEEKDATSVFSMESKSTYLSDGKLEHSIKTTMTYMDTGIGFKGSLMYNISIQGKYIIKNGNLIIEYNPNSFNVTPVEGTTPEDIVLTKYAYPIIEAELVPQMKQDLINQDITQILELTENHLILKESSGEQMKFLKEKPNQ
jgi:hypothetical protein